MLLLTSLLALNTPQIETNPCKKIIVAETIGIVLLVDAQKDRARNYEFAICGVKTENDFTYESYIKYPESAYWANGGGIVSLVTSTPQPPIAWNKKHYVILTAHADYNGSYEIKVIRSRDSTEAMQVFEYDHISE